MHERDEEQFERALRELRRPVPGYPAAERRLRAALAARCGPIEGSATGAARAVEPGRIRGRGAWLLAAAAAALVLAAGLLAALSDRATPRPVAIEAAPPPSTAAAAAADMPRRVRFTFRAPRAAQVAVTGDFNDWRPEATPLRRGPDGVWSATVTLRPGRYTYSFVVDGGSWRADPTAPAGPPDDFGKPSSVVLVEAAS